MIAPNLNPIVKSHLISLGYNNIEIYPINAYASSTPPFITWLEFPTVRSDETFWLHEASITYSVFDNDLSRAKDIAIALQQYLNVGDSVDNLKSLMGNPAPLYRLCWCRFATGGMFPPLERDGYSSISRTFNVGYIEV